MSKLKQTPIVIPTDRIEQSILLIRGQKVILDVDLAQLYEVKTGALIQAVKRNIQRFPVDFMFQLSDEEYRVLKSQIVILKKRRRETPYVFTESGVAMLSSVLRSERAIQVNIGIIRAFIRLRSILAEHKDLARKLSALEGKYDAQFKVVFNSIRELMAPPKPKKKAKLGFHKR